MKSEPLTLLESYGTTGSGRSLYIKDNKAVFRNKKKHTFSSLMDFVMVVFLPQGYPESVSSDYMAYQFWDTLQAFCSSITGTLAAQAVLKGYGVGDESASIAAATITWLLKDGSSMVGRITFAWARGTALDSECKKWRLVADFLNDTAIFVQLVSPHFPSIFTLLICFSGLLNAVVGVAGGATRAALTMHQARRNNMADVSAKDGSQETLVNLAALLFNMVLVPLVTGQYTLIFILFIFFTICHLYANWRAVKAVTMETFNKSRFHLTVHTFLEKNQREMLTVYAANLMEPLFSTDSHMQVHIGVSLETIYSLFSSHEIAAISTAYRDNQKNYLFFCKPPSNRSSQFHSYIVLCPGATEEDHLRSVFQAELISWCLSSPVKAAAYMKPLSDCLIGLNTSKGVQISLQSLCICEDMFDNFATMATRGNNWSLCPVLFSADEYRVDIFFGNGLVDQEFTLI